MEPSKGPAEIFREAINAGALQMSGCAVCRFEASAWCSQITEVLPALTHIHTHVCTYIRTCLQYTYIYIYVYMYLYTYTCIHTYTYVYYIHTRLCISCSLQPQGIQPSGRSESLKTGPDWLQGQLGTQRAQFSLIKECIAIDVDIDIPRYRYIAWLRDIPKIMFRILM